MVNSRNKMMRRTPGPSYGYEPLKQDDNALEEENQRLEEELKNKIGMLKSLTIDIGDQGNILRLSLLPDSSGSVDLGN